MKAVTRLNAGNLYTLLLVLLAVVAPHLEWLPLWLSGSLLLLSGWRAVIMAHQGRLPPRWLLTLLTVALIAGVLLQYRTLLGREGGVALLVALTGAKLLETQGPRDARLLIYLAYFLLLTSFMHSQAPAMAAYLFALTLVITALLIGWQRIDGFQPRANLRLAATLLLQALPLMLALFVLFPRIEGPLWRLPQSPGSAHSGLSDQMQPGSFSRMTRDDSIAFRAEFVGPQPEQEELYWRGPVFDQFDGNSWTQGPPGQRPASVRNLGPSYHYVLTLEAHQRSWLLALDYPQSLPADTQLSARGQLLSNQAVDKRRRIELSSAPASRLAEQEDDELLARAMALPAAGNPQSRALAASWRNAPPAERINLALAYFARQGLRYTLEPPLYPAEDGIDRFLFQGKLGFCEHFASSFVFLMRAAGLPARVVGGYQGGEANGGYLIVRQADAHAWAEVWLPGQGWRRVDPTSVVAPARLNEGLAQAVGNSNELPLMLRAQASWLKSLRLQLDVAVNAWNQWVIGYSPQQQQRLLQQLGIESLASSSFAWLFLGTLTAIIAPLVGRLLWKLRPPPQDPLHRGWLQLVRRTGRPAQPGEGPRDWLLRVCLEHPQWRASLHPLGQRYLQLRYGAAGPKQVSAVQHWLQAARRWRPARPPRRKP